MEKKYAVMVTSNFSYKTYEEAEKAAKQATATDNYGRSYVVAKAIALVEAPVPEAVVTKL